MDPPKTCGLNWTENNVGLFGHLTFGWVSPMVKRANTECRISSSDLYNIPQKEDTSRLGEKLHREWDKELTKHRHGKRASFRWALVKAGYHGLIAILTLVNDLFRFIKPVLFQKIILSLSPDSSITETQIWMYGSLLIFSFFVDPFLNPHMFYYTSYAGLQWQAGTVALIYDKVLSISDSALKKLSTGHIIDLVNSDAEKVNHIVWFLHKLWRTPLQIIVSVWYLNNQLGGMMLLSVFTYMLATLVWEQYLIHKLAIRREGNARATDERISMLNEILSSIRVIKTYCWEKAFGEKINKIRREELQFQRSLRNCVSTIQEMTIFNNRMVVGLAIATHGLTHGNTATAASIFPSVFFLNMLADAVKEITWGVNSWREAGVSIMRIQNFLLQEEDSEDQAPLTAVTDVQTNNQDDNKTSTTMTTSIPSYTPNGEPCFSTINRKKIDSIHKPDKQPVVEVKSLSAGWGSGELVLRNVSLDVKRGELLIVAGPVAAGKSSLLMSLLGELRSSSGSVSCRGRISYSAQQPWLFPSTVRQNILFGEKYDEDVYSRVVKAVALDKDFSALRFGDGTRVGERGVTLSGGQRARVGLARAVYRKADIYLLDDPLSAVDNATGQHIFNQCIRDLLGDAACVLVTHQQQYIPQATRILLLNQGHVDTYCTPEKLDNTKLDLYHTQENDSQAATVPECTENKQTVVEPNEDKHTEDVDDLNSSSTWSVFLRYLQAGGSWYHVFLLLALTVLIQVGYNISDYTMVKWSEQRATHSLDYEILQNKDGSSCAISDIPTADMCLADTAKMSMASTKFEYAIRDLPVTVDHWLSTPWSYWCILFFSQIIGVLMLALFRAQLFYNLATRASIFIHNQVYQSVIRSPVRFFDTKSKGEILGRFSLSMKGVDRYFPEDIFRGVLVLSAVIGNTILLLMMSPYLVIPLVIQMACMLYMRRLYLTTQKQYQSLHDKAWAPALTHLGATLEGLHTIKALKAQEHCSREYGMHYNYGTSTWNMGVGLHCWYKIRTNLIVCAYSATIVVACLLARNTLTAGVIGLMLNCIVDIMWQILKINVVSAEMETDIIRVKQVMDYTDLPSEAALETDIRPSPTWPDRGAVEFSQVSLRYYNNGPQVLNDVTFSIKCREKIGIVGRTGAGKSSLTEALFRLAEPSGVITIDGQKLSCLGLHDVRKAVTIIPQNPILFKGTLRENIDPFHEHDDHLLLKAFEQVNLDGDVASITCLDREISEGGTNLSVGERQLVCLSRALVAKPRILVLDEATANVDTKTDRLIQQTIKEQFDSCTVITIAHRLHTVMDCDRIMVLEKGNMVEFDTPQNLLSDKSTRLSSLIMQTGQTEQRKLLSIVKTMTDNHS